MSSRTILIEDESKFINQQKSTNPLAKLPYRELQKMAKKLKIPSKIKHKYLLAEVIAKKNNNEEMLNLIREILKLERRAFVDNNNNHPTLEVDKKSSKGKGIKRKRKGSTTWGEIHEEHNATEPSYKKFNNLSIEDNCHALPQENFDDLDQLCPSIQNEASSSTHPTSSSFASEQSFIEDDIDFNEEILKMFENFNN